MPHDEREKMLSEAILAFRNAVHTLTDPAPDLLASLSIAEDWSDLAVELPLVDFSPFASLPGNHTVQENEPGHTSSTAQSPASLPTVGQTGSPPVKPDRNLSQQPIFSLRRRGAINRGDTINRPPTGDKGNANPATPTGAQHSSSESGSKQKSAPVAQHSSSESGSRQKSPLTGGQPEGNTAFMQRTESQEERSSIKIPTAGDHSAQVHAFIQPLALLDNLVDSVLDSKTPGPAPERQFPQTHQSNRSFLQGNASRVTKAERDQSGGHDKSASYAVGDGVVSVIDSLTEQLLSPHLSSLGAINRAPTDRSEFGDISSEETAAPGKLSGYAETRVPGRTDDRERTNAVWSGLKGSQLDERGTTGLAASQPIDVKMLATLMNDILVEQAERHGVDLS